MSKKYFGTDGIRGQANQFPMTADIAMKVAMAAGAVLQKETDRKNTNRAVIGKDTRLSCYMLEQAITAGFLSMGIDVILTGPVPTPAVAMLTRSLRADIGVMVSASHNPFQDNGIKLFGPDGFKLDDAIEKKIEAKIEQDLSDELSAPADLGKASRLDDAVGRYVESIKQSLTKGQSLKGLRVVIDCAHGAAYKVAPQVLWELEAKVTAIGVNPNGRNINEGFGATSIENLQKEVLDRHADVGIALDGDADRIIMVDEKGQKIDGDQIMAALAVDMKETGSLQNDTLVSTVMSNIGLERFLKAEGITLERAAVGDRYVVEKMRSGGFNLGGEQSGHIVMSDFGSTGDGLLAAIQLLSILKQSDKQASQCLKLFEPAPQILKNVRYEGNRPTEMSEVQEAIKAAEEQIGNDGRIFVRPSGTEPVIRVMAEGDDVVLVEDIVNNLCNEIENASKAA